MTKLELLKKLPEEILRQLPHSEEERLSRIDSVSPEYAEGEVWQIWISGDVQKLGRKTAYLYLCAGSAIKPHTHTTDSEIYELVSGVLSANGETRQYQACRVGDSHCVDKVPEDTIIKSTKTRAITRGHQII